MSDEAKIDAVCHALDKVECECGQKECSQFHWFSTSPGKRMSVVCRICDADLIAKYGDKETNPGKINLNFWTKKGQEELIRRCRND